MAEKRPVCVYGGELRELDAADTLPSSGGGGSASVQMAVLTSTQVSNNSAVWVTLTGHTFTIPAGKKMLLRGIVPWTTTSSGTGLWLGVTVSQGGGANGNAVGSWWISVAQSSNPLATAMEDGDTFNVAGGATTTGDVMGAGSNSTPNHIATYTAVIENKSSNADTTVTVQFRPESGGNPITAQIGAAGFAIVG